MRGCAYFSLSLHMTVHTAVLIETIKALSSELHWWSCNIFSTQEHNVAVITQDQSSAVFSWKGESLKEYWNLIMND